MVAVACSVTCSSTCFLAWKLEIAVPEASAMLRVFVACSTAIVLSICWFEAFAKE